MNELKPEDVMRALECCASGTGGEACNGCPFNERKVCDNDMNALEKAALALLREKDAEIERLNEQIEIEHLAYKNLQELYYGDVKYLSDNITALIDKLETARAEAITEFAKELTSELIKGGIYPVFVKGAIERTAKKLKGATDGKTDL